MFKSTRPMVLCIRLNLNKYPAKTNIETFQRSAHSQSMPPPSKSSLTTNESGFEIRKNAFKDVFPSIVNSLLACPKLEDAKDVKGWIKEILYYNLKGGKLARGLNTVMAYETLDKPENVTSDNIRLSCIVGWCTEMLQAHLLMVDDIMDGGVMRRGFPCWYTLPNVGLRAVNDSVIVYATINYTLKEHFANTPQYTNLMNLFNEVLLFTTIGQLLDTSMAHRNKDDFSLFTLERYDAIVKYKTSYYTYILPVCTGMVLANITDEQLHRKAEDICFKMGRIFQMQDDFIDSYGIEAITGKLGSDIQEGKLSWLAITALKLSNDAQRKLFSSSYGRTDPACIEKIKALYEELDLQNIYREEQRRLFDEVVMLVNNLNTTTKLPELFLKLLDEIYNRIK